MHDNFFNYVEDAIRETKFDSFQSLAKYLSISPNRISQWKKGRGGVTPAECVLLAKLLGITVEELAFVIQAEREQVDDFREKWFDLAREYEHPVNPPHRYKKTRK